MLHDDMIFVSQLLAVVDLLVCIWDESAWLLTVGHFCLDCFAGSASAGADHWLKVWVCQLNADCACARDESACC